MKNQPSRFSAPPTEYDILQLLDYVNRTGSPETYSLISHTRPPLGLQHQLCCNIYVPRWKRPNGELIPCSLCDDRPKFLDGHVLWSEDGELRLVGNTCGPKHFGERVYRRLIAEVSARRALIVSEDYLLSALPEIPAMLSKLEMLVVPARRFRAVSSALRRRMPDMSRELWRAHTHMQDQLTVARRISDGDDSAHRMRSSFGNPSEFHTFRLGHLRGAHLFNQNFHPERSLEEHRAHLRALHFENPLDAICAMDNDHKVWAARSVQRARDSVHRLREKLSALPQFLLRENLSDLRRWSSDPDCLISVKVELQSRSVSFYADRRHNLKIDLGPQNDVPSLHDF